MATKKVLLVEHTLGQELPQEHFPSVFEVIKGGYIYDDEVTSECIGLFFGDESGDE
jgi:hypothetical protein